MRIVCQQTILMKYHALFVIKKKKKKLWKCRLLQIIGGALWANFLFCKKRFIQVADNKSTPFISN